MLIKERIYELFADLENVTLHFWINKIKIIMIITVVPKEGAKTEIKICIYICMYVCMYICMHAKDCKEIQSVHPKGNQS